MKHGGAEMAGSFNRITFTWSDYRQRGMSTPPNPILTGMDELSVVLPKTARNLHYRDDIGNISSSNARRDDRGYVLAQIRPRYPLLGGWKADWSFSYDVPTRSALKVQPSSSFIRILNSSTIDLVDFDWRGHHATEEATRATPVSNKL